MRGSLILIVIMAVLLFVGTGLYQAIVYAPETRATPGEITLYFANSEATAVVGEQRAFLGVASGKDILLELIKGPRNKSLWPTLPRGTTLLSFEVNGGTAYVNFSREVKDNFGGGTANELMLIYSVIASLTQLPGISSVQFMVEGQVEESIWGHVDTGVSLAPDKRFIAR